MFPPLFYFLYFLSLMILDGDTNMYLLEVEKNTGFIGSRKVNSSRGSYGHDYSDDKDYLGESESCKVGSCEGCSENQCYSECRRVFKGEKGKDKLYYHGRGKAKCVDATCKKKEDCKNQEHSGYDCDIYGYCESPCSYSECSKCAETQCKELDWSCDWKENKCVHKPECKKDADCLTLAHQEPWRCVLGDCVEGDLFCNKEGFFCDPDTMGGCEGCSANQCRMMENENDCVIVEGKSGEDKCVSNNCTNNKDCRKLFTNLCGWRDCVEGDLFCNKKGTCEQVACDPATMGGCEGCSINQCSMMENKKGCMVIQESGEEKCVSRTCTSTKDCRKLFVNDPQMGEGYECKNGTCEEPEYEDGAESMSGLKALLQ